MGSHHVGFVSATKDNPLDLVMIGIQKDDFRCDSEYYVK